MRRVRLQVHGRVQGVFFRASTQARARSLNLRGWVRNRADGSVEAVAEGPADAVALLVEFCRRGPPDARVDRLEVEELVGEAEALSEFQIRR